MNLFYLHVSESPRMNPVKLVVRKVSQNQKLEVLQNPNVQPSDRRSWDMKISKRRQIAKRPLRNVFNVAAVDLEQLQLPESDDPGHGHDLRVLDAEDRQLPQEVDRVRRQALQSRLLYVDLTLSIGISLNIVSFGQSKVYLSLDRNFFEHSIICQFLIVHAKMDGGEGVNFKYFEKTCWKNAVKV